MKTEEIYDKYLDEWSISNNPILRVSDSSRLSIPRIPIIQDKREMVGLLDFARDNLQTRQIALEVGLGLGGTHLLLKKLFPLVITIESNINSIATFLLGLAGDGSKIVHGDSTTSQTRDAVAGVLGDLRADFLFIDGHHSYASVHSDFVNYEPFVRSGGVVGFHDSCASGPKRQIDEIGKDVFTHFSQSGRMGISCYVKR